jgi:hypothetical protein
MNRRLFVLLTATLLSAIVFSLSSPIATAQQATYLQIDRSSGPLHQDRSKSHESAPRSLSLTTDPQGRLWVENAYYRIELTDCSSFVIKTGTGEKEWRIFDGSSGNSSGKWVGGAVNHANHVDTTFWNFYNAPVDSLTTLENTSSQAVVRIISHGPEPSGSASVEDTLTFRDDTAAIRIDARVISDTYPSGVTALTHYLFVAAGGDTLNDYYTWSGGTPTAFPNTSWRSFYANQFTPTSEGFIHLTIYDTATKQGLAQVTRLSETFDHYTDINYGRGQVHGAIYAWDPYFQINLDASRTTTLYLYPFTIGPVENPAAPVDDFINSLGGNGFKISGRVSDSGNSPIPGVTVSTDTGLNTLTDSDGYYTLSGVVTGTYTLTPDKNGYIFMPSSRVVTVPDPAPQDFTAVDILPPAAISDLTASTGSGAGNVNLTWTAPGDDQNTGTAREYDIRYSSNPIAENNFAYADKVQGAPVPAVAGTNQSLTVHLPFAGKTYFFAIKAADETPNWSNLSNPAPVISGSSADTTSPGRVSDLTAITGSSGGSINLSWTAPADDGCCEPANHYKLRWSQTYISENNWATSQEVSGLPTPASPGTRQGITVSGLTPGALYHFALRAYDEAGNPSGISNDVSATAYQAPIPDLTITDLTFSPNTQVQGGTVQVNFTVVNQGSATVPAQDTQIYLALNENGFDCDLGLQRVPALEPGASKAFALNINLPKDIRPGNYWLEVKADRNHIITETDITNNLQKKFPLTITGTPPPIDLSITGIEVSQGIQVFHQDDQNYHDPGNGQGYGLPPWCGGKPCTYSVSAWPWKTSGPGNNGVRLVRNRPAVVRVYVKLSGAAKQDNVVVRLKYDVGVGWSPSNGLFSKPKTVYSGRDARNPTPDLFSFDFWLTNDDLWPVPSANPGLKLEATVDPYNAISETDEYNNIYPNGKFPMPTPFPFYDQRQLKIGIVPIEIVLDKKSIGTGSVNNQAIYDYENYAVAVLPFSTLDWYPYLPGLQFDNSLPSIQLKLTSGNCKDKSANNVLVNSLEDTYRKTYDYYSNYDVIVGIYPHKLVDLCAAFKSGNGILAGQARNNNGTGHSLILIDEPGVDEYGVLAHELSHLVPGLKHNSDCNPNANDNNWPYPGLYIKEFGVVVAPYSGRPKTNNGIISWKFDDIISYCSSRWISPFSWEAWMAKSYTDITRLDHQAATTGNFLIVSADVYTDGLTLLDPIWETGQSIPATGGVGDYCVNGLDDNATVLASTCFALDFIDTESLQPKASDRFSVTLPQNPNLREITLSYKGVLLGQVDASASVPSITVNSPAGGENLDHPFTISWTGADLDEGPLYYNVYYSPDGGSAWKSLTGNIITTSITVDPAGLPGTTNGKIKITVSDGFNVSQGISNGTFSIPFKAPVPSIQTDPQGPSIPYSTTLKLASHIYDPDDENSYALTYTWTSSLDGLLGKTPRIETANLTEGIHLISLIVTDTQGLTGTQSIYLEVLQDQDRDGMPDQWEQQVGLDPVVNDALADADQDGLLNGDEHRIGTDPLLPDTDYDGYNDSIEIIRGSDPLDPDSIPPTYEVYCPLIKR